jgi:hypothetical protein
MKMSVALGIEKYACGLLESGDKKKPVNNVGFARTPNLTSTQTKTMFYPSMVGNGLSSSYASATALAAQSTAREAQTNVDLLSHDIDRLLMITEAMWTLMKKEHGYTDDVLTGLIKEIDSRKVIVDGITIKDPPQPCPGCGKINSAKRMFCIYCGKPILAHPFAR